MHVEYRLVLPDESHEAEYMRVMDQWEALEDNIQPELMRRGNTAYAKFLSWCADDRTTGSMLSTKVPASLHFLVSRENEIAGAVVINHTATHRGHIHAGIVPWHRGKGYGTLQLRLALSICAEMGMDVVQIVPNKDNAGAVQTILRNGGVLQEEFIEDGVCSQRYAIHLPRGEA